MISPKIIAMYFTQLHQIPENDKWWGEGFTDWRNVKAAGPLFEGHHQPRVPQSDNYYDQSELETVRAQVNLAREYGIHGFCHYHYWFDGHQLLETPTNLFLENRDIDFPFCLSWANETWSRRWDGKDHDILIQQTHPPDVDRWELHFQYLIRAWTDERAIIIDGRPLFVIYRPHKIPKIDQMIDYWNQRAQQNGLKGLFLVFQKQFELQDERCLESFDASFQFEPFHSLMSTEYSTQARFRQNLRRIIDRMPESFQSAFWSLWATQRNRHTSHDYDEIWTMILKKSRRLKPNEFPGAFADWDNTARYGNRATIVEGASPSRFRHWFSKLVEQLSNRPEQRNFLFFNAWNEWAECAYLEPDTKHGLQYLEAIRDVVGAANSRPGGAEG